MITALDTNVLLDVFLADRAYGEASRAALMRCVDEGGLVASEVVWAEVATFFPEPSEGARALEDLGVRFVEMDEEAALVAAQRWAAHRRRSAGRRQRPPGDGERRVAADFLIGAHALRYADRLLTRDRGFYRRAFRGLEVLDPTKS